MALRDRRINISFKLGCLVASGGLDIWVSSTCFQKSNFGWPQQPPTEKVLKFNMTFHDSTQKKPFSKHQNKAEFKNLNDSEVPSSDFTGLRTSAASMTSTASSTSMASMTSTASFHQKKILILMVWSSLAPKWSIPVPFCRMDHQKSNFSLISDILSVRGCWGQPILLFWKLVDKNQMS